MSKSELTIKVPTCSGGVVEVTSDLHCVKVDPHGPLQKIIIGLHGFGDNAQNFAALAKEIKAPGAFWVIPEAPTPVPFSMASGSQWFPLFSEFHGELSKSVGQVLALLEKLKAASGLGAQNIYVMGFSQGASVSLNVLCKMKEQLGGVLALSGFFAGGHRVREVSAEAKQTPLLLAHGLQDNVVLPTMHFESLDATKILQFEKVTARTYSCGHTLHPQEIKDIETFIARGTL
jgi:phospholipase/carboxylesterase